MTKGKKNNIARNNAIRRNEKSFATHKKVVVVMAFKSNSSSGSSNQINGINKKMCVPQFTKL